nr:MAG TPA: hypothetical protein [Caudoviricetes sp.]
MKTLNSVRVSQLAPGGGRQNSTPSVIAGLLKNSPGVKILSKWILD